MTEITSQTVSIGKDAYGRPVTMTRRKNYDGKILWEIKTEAISQRDDTQRLGGLSDDNVRQMTQALDVLGKK